MHVLFKADECSSLEIVHVLGSYMPASDNACMQYTRQDAEIVHACCMKNDAI